MSSCYPILGTVLGAGIGLYVSGVVAVEAFKADSGLASTIVNNVTNLSPLSPPSQALAFPFSPSWVKPTAIALSLLGAWLGYRVASGPCRQAAQQIV